MSDIKGTKQRAEVLDGTTTTARLPRLEIEIFHRRSPTGDSEQISISMQAVPSFEALGRVFGTANPFAFWALAWSPWIDAMQSAMLPWYPPAQRPRRLTSPVPSHSSEEQGSSR